MTNPVIEAMARAHYERDPDRTKSLINSGPYAGETTIRIIPWEDADDMAKDFAFEAVRAFLQALKDNVSEEMVRSGIAVAQNCSLSGDYTWPVYIEDLICNVLDTAMKEETDSLTGPLTMVPVPKTPLTRNWPGAIEWPDEKAVS